MYVRRLLLQSSTPTIARLRSGSLGTVPGLLWRMTLDSLRRLDWSMINCRDLVDLMTLGTIRWLSRQPGGVCQHRKTTKHFHTHTHTCASTHVAMRRTSGM